MGGINAILLTFLTPPFQVHDEFQHFFRSYQLSEAEIWGSVQDGHPGSVIPSSLPEFVERSWGTLEVWHVPPLGTHRLAETWREFQQPLAPSRRQFAEFITVDYSPILYVPQTLGIAAGRLFGASPLALLYLGRLANAATAIVVIAWSLKVLPMGRAMALAVALLPMGQFEYGSVAPDATIIASGFLLTATSLRASLRNEWPRTDVLISAIAAGIVCSKVVYSPLLAIGIPAMLQLGKSRISRNSSDASVVNSPPHRHVRIGSCRGVARFDILDHGIADVTIRGRRGKKGRHPWGTAALCRDARGGHNI